MAQDEMFLPDVSPLAHALRRGGTLPVLVLALAAIAVPARDASAVQPAAEALADRIGGGVYLGQVYPSGRLYLEGFSGASQPAGERGTDGIVFVALDDVGIDASAASRPEPARWVGRTDAVSPPQAEGMLAPDSPCAGDGYEPREGFAYAERSGGGSGVFWRAEEYFATVEEFGCGSEIGLLLYQAEEPPPRSFRVLALAADLAIGELDRTVAGTPRPLTPEDEASLRERSERAEDCTLEPRDVDGATQLVAFRAADSGLRVRISSHVSACTALAEVFLLDVLSGDEVLRTFRISRWRGNP